MKTKHAIIASLSTEADVVPTAIYLPTAPRIHAVASSSSEDQVATQQVETATIVGTITTSGNATVIVTSAGMAGSPKSVTVAVLENDDASAIATKIRAALVLDSAIGHASTGKFVVSGETNKVILTAKVATTHDGTLNINVADDTSVGITEDTTSDTTVYGSGATGSVYIKIVGIGSDWKEVSETIQLNGVTSVNTVNSYRFINDMYSVDTKANVGAISATAATDSTLTSKIAAGAGGTQESFFMNSADRIVYLDELNVSAVNTTTTALTTIKVKVKDAYGYWITKGVWYLLGADYITLKDLGIAIPPQATIKITGTASASTSAISAFMTIK